MYPSNNGWKETHIKKKKNNMQAVIFVDVRFVREQMRHPDKKRTMDTERCHQS